MRQCLYTAAVFASAWNVAPSLPAIAGITPIHHRDFRQSIHSSGLLVPSICLLHLHRAPLDEKPYASHVSGSLRADAVEQSTSLPFGTSPRNIHSAAVERVIEEHSAQFKSFELETAHRQVTFDQARRATENGLRVEIHFVAAGNIELHIDPVKDEATAANKSPRRFDRASLAPMHRDTSSPPFRQISEAASQS